ncbi:NAD(P)-dependent oxidoreductase [Massilibacteroides sp.]|uniref:NAD(P)-dependent oxidoreductase n=1 Tax=Massilibacteroides sp. TaxID=2034766 RepID=UPI0026217866|nr:NAD(P)-dependent oxidoreductase [Massilibacteroides sp.]MDD4514566.1 NAD(P)-dependent oxidoreductase [Massilibacteroides sp.]
MKKVVLIGATGFVGSAILKEALSRGINVTAVARHPEKISEKSDHLQTVAADIFSEDAVVDLVKGYDAVISAYNPGWTNPNIVEDTEKGYTSIINGVKKAGVKRLLIVGGAGSLYVSPGKTVLDSGVIPDAILPAVKSLAQVLKEKLLPEKELDWAFFSPAGTIEPGERTGKYRLGLDDLIINVNGESKISVEDYAKAMIDELEAPQHHHQRFTIGY